MTRAVSRTVTIRNPHGLHARPAAIFVRFANQFQARVTVKKDNEQANGKSIMEILTLAAHCGTKVTIEAVGEDAEAAVEALSKILSAVEGTTGAQ